MTIFPPLIKSSTSTGDVCGASLNYSLGIGPYMVIEPSLIADLRPTQMTVGMREVHIKRRRLREMLPRPIGRISAHAWSP
jgi:hypothetical protein